ALDGAPGSVLRCAEFLLFSGMPSNSGGIKKNGRALERRQPRAFRIPLVPAHERADAAYFGVKGAKAEIAGSEVVLFVVERIVWDVHFAVKAAKCAIGVKKSCRVVIDTCRTLFEERGNQDNLELFCQIREFLCRRPGNGFCKIEQGSIFALAEILSLKKFRKADDLGPARGSLTHEIHGPRQVFGGIRRCRHLHQSDLKFLQSQCGPSGDLEYQ